MSETTEKKETEEVKNHYLMNVPTDLLRASAAIVSLMKKDERIFFICSEFNMMNFSRLLKKVLVYKGMTSDEKKERAIALAKNCSDDFFGDLQDHGFSDEVANYFRVTAQKSMIHVYHCLVSKEIGRNFLKEILGGTLSEIFKEAGLEETED